ncbi:HprK-related kinase A [Desertibaculum subflavum]|uniref:HprK-related kinase A n=1 Tax=Desertibaculum subflavum TaxID=2268458 RepID=UPI000E66E4D7
MKLGELSTDETAAQLAGAGLALETGPFAVNLRCAAPGAAAFIRLLYPEHRVATGEVVHTDVAVRPHFNRRRPWRREAQLHIDDRPLMQALPRRFAAPMLEWGLNFAIGSRAHHLLILHAAVVEKNGRAVVMAAVSGSGKSTLCAALVSAGWRLFSDEFGLIRPADGALMPVPRPVSLKNESIEVVRRLMPAAVISPPYHDTAKGTLAYLRPPDDAVRRQFEPAMPAWIVFPKFRAGAPLTATPVPRAQAFADLLANSMNYIALAERGFAAMARLVESCPAFALEYSDIPAAIAHFEGLAAGETAA